MKLKTVAKGKSSYVFIHVLNSLSAAS